MNEVLRIIAKRRSIRRYKTREVDKETIIQLLKAGMAAPTANNRQPWEFIVTTDRAILDSMVAIGNGTPMLAKAPLCITVCGNLERAHKGVEIWAQDCSAATENILLAAESLGLGGVWCGIYTGQVGDQFVQQVSSLLKLPSQVIPLCTIVLGYPDEDPPPKNKWREERVHWQTW